MAESEFTLDTLNVLLFEWFPVLRIPEYLNLIGEYPTSIDDVDGLSPHVVLGIVFNRYIDDMVISGTSEDRAKVGGFLENMAKAKDQGVVELLRKEILPTLWETQRTIDAYWEYLGIETQRVLIWLGPKDAPRITLPSD